MNAVWIDQPARKTIPSPGLSLRRPSRPRRRRNAVSATTQRSQTTSPSSSRRRTSAPGGPAISGRSEDLADGVEGRAEQDDEHGWEDEEDQREENLDRSLLRPFLGHRTPALAHLDREVAHDLSG